MNREELLQLTIDKLQRLPENKLIEVSDFAEFLLSRIDEHILTEGIKRLAGQSKAYDFLKDEDIQYTVNDLKERYR
jgi:hypothetical protein